MKLKPFLVTNILLLLAVIGFSQSPVKREFEQSIRKNQTPPEILEKLSPLIDQARRVRYFRESDGQQLTWEVKMNLGGRHFSIEFFDDLSLKDVEELIRWGRLDKTIKDPLSNFFKENYSRYRIKRFQKQFVPSEGVSEQDLLSMILKGETFKPKGYEVEAEVIDKESGELGFFEFQFDDQFRLKNKRKIIGDPDGNLFF